MSTAASTPWAVKTTKRKSTPLPTTTATSRKRQRLSDDHNASEKRKSKQQTLTQIDWVPSSRNVSFIDDEDELEHIGVDIKDGGADLVKISRRSGGRKGQRKSALKKRDSTLTQMEFFSAEYKAPEDEDYVIFENHAGPAVQELQQCPGGEQDKTILQIDGTYDSPRKRRKGRRTSIDLAIQSATDIFSDGGYRPTKKKKSTQKEAELCKPRQKRASERPKRILSDSEQNLNYIDAALREDGTTPTVLREARQSSKLEIRGAMEEDADDYSETTPRKTTLKHALSTPRRAQRTRIVIPSSQSPESLPPSTWKKTSIIDLTTPRRSAKRQPLQAISVNTPNCREFNTSEKILSFQSTISPSPTRRISILKLPNKKEQMTKARTEDSHTDVFSIPATSSPRPDRQPPEQFEQPAAANGGRDPEQEIPGTSQSTFDLDKNMSSAPEQETLPSLVALVGMSTEARTEEASARFAEIADQSTFEESPVLVRDFAVQRDHNNTPRTREQARAEPAAPTQLTDAANRQGSIDEPAEGDEDANSTFGSPIANDTQFNMDWTYRSSSPAPKISFEVPAWRQDLLDKVSDGASPPPPSSGRDDSIGDLLLPPPRLVHHSTTTTVPLNDISEVPSSSPLLLLSTNQPTLPTQRSIRPASMPRQSQISTQEPTQDYQGISSPLPHYHSVEASQEIDRITIKDSSSIGVPLIQMPQYQDEESQLNVDFGLDDDEDDSLDLDLDLDPSSIAPPTQSQHQRSQRHQQFHHQEQAPQSSSPETNEPNFTQGGHPTAARMKRLKRQGLVPKNYVQQESFVVPKMPDWYFDDPFEGMGLDNDEEQGNPG